MSRKSITIESLAGRTFGRWTVLDQVEAAPRGQRKWLCQCGCEAQTRRFVLERSLTSGVSRSCGCLRREKAADISGMVFHSLTALYPLAERSPKGYVMWHCRCQCGRELDVSYNDLKYSNLRSCGCQREAYRQNLNSQLTRACGTSLDLVRSKKLPKDNTTGCRGVYFIRGRYTAKINFQKKTYTLGAFDTLEAAAQARAEAEMELFDGFAEHYERWQQHVAALDAEEGSQRADQWAAENPVQVIVAQDSEKRVHARFLPELPELLKLPEL